MDFINQLLEITAAKSVLLTVTQITLLRQAVLANMDIIDQNRNQSNTLALVSNEFCKLIEILTKKLAVTKHIYCIAFNVYFRTFENTIACNLTNS